MENKDQPTTEAPQQQSQQQAQAVGNGVDIEAISNKISKDIEAKAEKIASETAAKAAAQRLKQIGAELAGEQQVDPKKKILEHMVEDPIAYAHNLKEITKREVREEMAENARLQNLQYSVVSPFVQEYPELKTPTRLALVEKLAEQLQEGGKDYAQALKEACETTVKELNLKSVSEAERESAARSAAFMPLGGSVIRGTPQFDETKSSNDFFAGMKAKASSLRKRA